MPFPDARALAAVSKTLLALDSTVSNVRRTPTFVRIARIAGLPGRPDASNGKHNSSHITMKVTFSIIYLALKGARSHWLTIEAGPSADQRTTGCFAARFTDSATAETTLTCARPLVASLQSHTVTALGQIQWAITSTPKAAIRAKSPIIGVRYQCLNCPSKHSSFNLDCEVKSYRVHDPMHVFLKIPRPVDIPGPLESEFPIIPILYRDPAGPPPGSPSASDPAAYLRDLTHAFARCDRHMQRIVGKWYRSLHVFLVIKAPVDMKASRHFADLENPAGSPPVLRGNIYLGNNNSVSVQLLLCFATVDRKNTLSLLHYAYMSNGPRYSLDPNGPERTDKPLIIECDYNTNRQNLSFDSARDCSYDELRSKVKEGFRLSARPFKIQWKDDDGEQNGIHDEATLDDAIKFYHSTAENSVTVLVQISLEYNGPSHSPLAGREEQVSFPWGEVSGPQRGGDAMTAGSKVIRCRSRQDRGVTNGARSQDAAGSSRASTRSTDEGGTERSILNGSIDEERNASFHERLSLQTAREREWLREAQASHQMIAAFDTLSTISSSFSLNTNSPLSDGLPDTDIPPERRENYTDSRSSGSTRDSEYEAPVNQSRSNYDTGISTREFPVPQEVTCCSECDCILDQIKGKGRSSEPSSPTQTILARSPGSSGSSSSTVRAGYELCATCFEKVGADHSSASSVKVSYSRTLPPTPQERDIARRSAPKRKGQLRHAFLEQFCDLRGWKVVEQDETSRPCSGCESELSGDRYKCGICEKFTLCRACYSDVHDIHPIHAFLEMKANKPTSETRSYSEVSDDATSDDNVDEPSLKHLGYQCSYCQQDIVGPRFHCVDCEKDVNICSDCDIAGLSGSPYASNGEHSSSHITMKIPVPINETQDVSQLTHGRRYSQGSATVRSAPGVASSMSVNTVSYGNGAGTDQVEDYIQCPPPRLPLSASGINALAAPPNPHHSICARTARSSQYRVHNPMHTFLKIPRPVDIPGPLESELPIIPILYRYPAGPAPGSPSDISSDPEGTSLKLARSYFSSFFIDVETAYLRDLKHNFALCDRHVSRGRIVGKWYRCAFCAKDLCADCEALDTHDSTHAFLVLKAPC
ncbi:hypothetical protein EDB89DRAFT_2069195 [Lactarius sanguifluus]|nr:hypothetical protein EDB89DRAFT_2069195 [Lactarius sanguifluus]